jgi:hypothetical protein
VTTYEFHVRPERSQGKGWRGWEITLESEAHPTRTYSFNESEGVASAAEAVRRAFDENHDADRCVQDALIGVGIQEIRVLVTSDISPN